jgi:hypothetical protein
MINTCKALPLAIGTILTISLIPLSSVDARDPWEYWNEIQLKHALKDDLDLKLKTEQKVRNGLTELFLTNYDIGLVFKHNEHFELGAAYKFEHQKSSSGDRTDENRLSLEGTFKWSRDNLKFSNRHRVSHRDIDGEKSWRYRTRIKVARPAQIGDFHFTPFVSEEILYYSEPAGINQNRAAIGFSKELSENRALDLCYVLKSSRNGTSWDDTNVIGLMYNIRF